MSGYIAIGILQLWNSLRANIDKGLSLTKEIDMPDGVPNVISRIWSTGSKLGFLILKTIVALCVAGMVAVAVFVKILTSDEF